jgi:hypothetical protein
MADTLGRVIKRAPAGGGSTSDLFAAYRALGSGTFQVWMTSDLNLLGDESTYRTLRSVPGFDTVDQPSPGLPGISETLDISDFDWSSALLTPNPANVCLGTHVFHRNAVSPAAWPNITFRARIETLNAPTDFAGVILVLSPGRQRAPTQGDRFAWAVIPGAASVWDDIVLTIPDTAHGDGVLTDADFEQVVEYPMLGDGGSSGVPTIGEPLSAYVATVWFGAFSSTGKVQILGCTLATEPA